MTGLEFEILSFGDLGNPQVAVLSGGGVESCVLLGLLGKSCRKVFPVYVRSGLSWEKAELAQLHKFIDALEDEKIEPLKELAVPVDDIYDRHWSVTGIDVPGSLTDDAAVFLPGRNLLLIAKVAVWAAMHDIDALVMGSLKSNPFPDASAVFFSGLEHVAELALERPIKILRPWQNLSKSQVIELGKGLPLHYTFSCISPVFDDRNEPLHCGQCNKCYERMTGFARTSFADPTKYAGAVGEARIKPQQLSV